MTISELRGLIKSDLKLYSMPAWRAYITCPGYKYTVNHRICYYFSQHKLMKPLFILWWLKMKHLTHKFGIQMSWKMNLPEQTTIAHFGGITFFPESCGRGVYLRQGVTVGSNGRGNPHIGENVNFGANVIAIGPIRIGNNAQLGAGAVIVKDVPDNAVVVGNPARVIKILNP